MSRSSVNCETLGQYCSLLPTAKNRYMCNALCVLCHGRAVINHFRPKVDSWAKVNHLSSLTEEQVLEVVKSNYDTLTLKLHDSLDQFDRYNEKPETNFFLNMVSYTTQDFV